MSLVQSKSGSFNNLYHYVVRRPSFMLARSLTANPISFPLLYTYFHIIRFVSFFVSSPHFQKKFFLSTSICLVTHFGVLKTEENFGGRLTKIEFTSVNLPLHESNFACHISINFSFNLIDKPYPFILHQCFIK